MGRLVTNAHNPTVLYVSGGNTQVKNTIWLRLSLLYLVFSVNVMEFVLGYCLFRKTISNIW